MINAIDKALTKGYRSQVRLSYFAGALLALLVAFSVTSNGAMWFESSMSRHMLLQFPLLIVLGAASFPNRSALHDVLTRLDPFGAIGFICFTGWMLFWMLPLNLDVATFEHSMRMLKLISVPVGIGMAFRWLWLRANAILKCVVVFESLASIIRLGWLYLESPLQLCSSYLIGEQKQVGIILLLVSASFTTIVIFYSLFGSFNKNFGKQRSNSR